MPSSSMPPCNSSTNLLFTFSIQQQLLSMGIKFQHWLSLPLKRYVIIGQYMAFDQLGTSKYFVWSLYWYIMQVEGYFFVRLKCWLYDLLQFYISRTPAFVLYCPLDIVITLPFIRFTIRHFQFIQGSRYILFHIISEFVTQINTYRGIINGVYIIFLANVFICLFYALFQYVFFYVLDFQQS